MLACVSSQGEHVAIAFTADVHVIVKHFDRRHPIRVIVSGDLLLGSARVDKAL